MLRPFRVKNALKSLNEIKCNFFVLHPFVVPPLGGFNRMQKNKQLAQKCLINRIYFSPNFNHWFQLKPPKGGTTNWK